MDEDEDSIGFIGLGSMGAGMAHHLLKNGYRVTGFDVDKAPMERFAAAGGQLAISPRTVASQNKCKIFIIMVATPSQAKDVLFDNDSGVVQALPQGPVVLLCITATAADVQAMVHKLSTELQRSDVTLLDCPVSGGANRSSDGTLSILVSGKENIPSSATKVLETMSHHLFHVPGSPGSASALKMVHQILVGAHILAAVETAGLVNAASLDLKDIIGSVMSSGAASWLYGERSPHLADMENGPYSSLGIILKDLVRTVTRNTSELLHLLTSS